VTGHVAGAPAVPTECVIDRPDGESSLGN